MNILHCAQSRNTNTVKLSVNVRMTKNIKKPSQLNLINTSCQNEMYKKRWIK